MHAVNRDAAIRFYPISSYPGLYTAAQSAAARLVAHLTGSEKFSTVAFGTEGGLFHQSGIPSVICGPGSMAQGHKPDEFITIEQLNANIALLLPDIKGHSPRSHAALGAWMLALWGLPGDLVEIVARQAQPSRLTNNSFGAIGTVHVAVALANNNVPDNDYLEQTGMLNQLPLWQQMLAHIKETHHD